MANNYLVGENKSLRKYEEPKTINSVNSTAEMTDASKIYSYTNELYYVKAGTPAMVGGTTLIATTWSGLKTLRDTGNLIEGCWYRITDYDCILNSESTWVISAHNVYDILVLATSKNTISETARAIRHEGDVYFQCAKLEAWKLKYCLDNDQTRFKWCGTDDDGGKGVVYWLMDERGNECDYDFKNVKMKRYEITATTLGDNIISYSRAFTSLTSKSGWTIGSTAYYFYTFSWCPNSTLNAEDVFDLSVMDLSSNSAIVFKNNKFLVDDGTAELKPSCCIITKLASESSITLTQFTTFNLYDNRGETGCYGNTFNCKYSTNQINTRANSFGAGCDSNSFGAGCNNNSFGANCDSNSFGAGCDYWTVTSSNGNTVGNYIQGTSSSRRTLSSKTRTQVWS